MILLVNASETRPQTDKILVILSAAKDLAERSDTGRVAGVRSFAEARRLLRATQDDREEALFNTKIDTFRCGWTTQAELGTDG